MKFRNKWILTFTSIGVVASAIVPFVTSCSCNPTNIFIVDTEVQKNYSNFIDDKSSGFDLRISGFRFDSKEHASGLDVKVVTKEDTETNLTASYEITSEDGLLFDVIIHGDKVLSSQNFIFDLSFTNDIGNSFTSKDYTIHSTVIEWNDRQACAQVDDKLVFFSNLSDSKICDESGESDIVSVDGEKFEREDFNYPIILNPELNDIPMYFLNNCKKFNHEIKLPESLTIIKNAFMVGCESFNKPLELPLSVTTIRAGFLSNCKKFNQKLDVFHVETIIPAFLDGCTSFNQNLNFNKIKNNAWTNGSFMHNCDNMISTITFNSPNMPVPLPSIDECLSSDNPNANCVKTGITIICGSENTQSAQTIREKIPERADSTPYRHLLFPQIQ